MLTAAPTTGELIAADAAADDDESFWHTPAPTQAETSFRHRGWAVRRQKIDDALVRTGMSWRRIERFRACGACAVIEHSPSTDRFRVTAFFCHDRNCVPCANAKAAELRRILIAHMHGRDARLITLTIKHRDAPLRDELKRLRKAFQKLRATKWWKRLAKGGVVCTEVKRGADGGWHPHLHIIVEGSFIPVKELSEAWLKATGDSYIVDVRRITNDRQAAAYVTKYVTKPIDSKVIDVPEDLDEAIKALHHARMYEPFGTWRVELMQCEANDPGDWTPVCTVVELARSLKNNEKWAQQLWQLVSQEREEKSRDAPEVKCQC